MSNVRINVNFKVLNMNFVLKLEKFIYSFQVTPTMALFINNQPILENETVTFEYGVDYLILCTAVNSRPDVSLTIYDTDTKLALSQNSIYNSTCDPTTEICNAFYQILFRLDDTNNNFDNMNSFTCFANSKINDLNLTKSIVRKINVILPTTTEITTTTTTTTTTSNIKIVKRI